MNFQIDRSKSINSMLFIIQSLNEKSIGADIHKVMKLMFFADKDHLINYGFPITGDTYIKLPYGPVPSFSNYVARDENDDFKGIISRNGNILSGNRAADMDDLSDSEVESLSKSINEYGNYSFHDLTNISHSFAYNSSEWNISYGKIAEEGGVDEDMKAFIREQILNDNISFSK